MFTNKVVNDSLYEISYLMDSKIQECYIKLPFNILIELDAVNKELFEKFEPDSNLRIFCNQFLNKKFPDVNCIILKVERIL